VSEEHVAQDGRLAHLVGSIPAESGVAAMELAHEHLDGTMRWLPDGETGDRFHWVIHIIEGLRGHPDLEVATDGDFSDYDHLLQFRVRKGHKLRGDTLDFGHVQAFRESYEEFKRVRAEIGDERLTFQVGIPGDFDMAGMVLGPRGALLNRKPFHEATVAEVRAIFAEAGRDVVFQIEVPFELVFVARAPSAVRPLAARLLARAVTAIARDAPAGARFGVHLCLGDMNHRALVAMKDSSPVVTLANAIARGWPSGRELEFMHAPFSGASQPPPLDPAYYAPLARLRLPEQTRFVAGFVYEHQALEEQEELLRVIEGAAGRRVDVSAACGLGRRSLDEAVASMQRARALARA
jgi:hypothetical protein